MIVAYIHASVNIVYSLRAAQYIMLSSMQCPITVFPPDRKML